MNLPKFATALLATVSMGCSEPELNKELIEAQKSIDESMAARKKACADVKRHIIEMIAEVKQDHMRNLQTPSANRSQTVREMGIVAGETYVFEVLCKNILSAQDADIKEMQDYLNAGLDRAGECHTY